MNKFFKKFSASLFILTLVTAPILSARAGYFDNFSFVGLRVALVTDLLDYFKLDGRSGGQVAIGGTDASDNLTLQSTSNATKGKIFFGANSVYDEVEDRLGIGTTNPVRAVDVVGTGRFSQALNVGNAFDFPEALGDLVVGRINGDSRFLFGQSISTFGGMTWDYNATLADSSLKITSDASGGSSILDQIVLIRNGDVGFNQPNPTAKTHIKGSTSDNSAYALKVDDSSDSSLFSVRNDGNIYLGTNSVYDGVNDRLGINTNSPSSSVQIGEIGSGRNEIVKIVSDAGRTWEMGATDSGNFTYFGVTSPHNFRLFSGGNEVMRFNSNGSIGAGYAPSIDFFGVKSTVGTLDNIFAVRNTLSMSVFKVTKDGNTGFGFDTLSEIPSAKAHIKGSTSDDTAYSLKVDDSSDDSLFSVRNDGEILQNDKQAFAENTIIINSVDDLPTPTDTSDGLGLAHRLVDGKTYEFGAGAAVTLSYPIVMTNNLVKGDWESPIIYDGSGALFRNNATTPLGVGWLDRIRVIGDGTNEFIDIRDGGTLIVEGVNMISFKFGSFINNDNAYFTFSTPIAMTGQLDVVSTQDIFLIREQNNNTMASMGGQPLYNFRGAGGVVSIGHVAGAPYSSDALFNFDPVTWDGRADLDINYFDAINGGDVFLAGSLDQTDPRIRVNNFMDGVPDSQIIGSLYMEHNTTETTITTQGLDGDITAFADAGGGQVTVTSASHGLGNGDEVWIIDTDYTGKYTISNVATDTFEITETFSGTTTATWETEWVKIAGTTFPMENERASMTDNNEITFTNLEEKSVSITANIGAKNTSVAAVRNWEFAIMKNDSRIRGGHTEAQFLNVISNNPILATTTAMDGDVFELFARNMSDSTTQLTVVGESLVIK